MKTLYRGLRGSADVDKNGIPTFNQYGVIFATENHKTAEIYGEHVAEFILASDKIMDFDNQEAVKMFVELLAEHPDWDGDDLSDPDTREALVHELINPREAMGNLNIVENGGVMDTLEQMGYDAISASVVNGVRHYVIINREALQSN